MTDGESTTLGIIAGRGSLPLEIAKAASGTGRNVFILALQDHAEDCVVAEFPHKWVRLGQGGEALNALRTNGVKDLIFAGGVKRPSLLSLRPDFRAAKFLAKVGFRALGDDTLLRAIVREFEAEGFNILGSEDIWREAMMPAGQLTESAPDEQDWKDIARGVDVSQALGNVDVGHSVVVQQGIVLAVEAVEGTDAVLQRAGQLLRDGGGGVLVKTAKPNQEMRIDLPAIGLTTVQNAVAAGLAGIAVEAGAAIFLDRNQAVAAANDAGLFMIGMDPTGLPAAAVSDEH